jgi:hypothetical protein
MHEQVGKSITAFNYKDSSVTIGSDSMNSYLS